MHVNIGGCGPAMSFRQYWWLAAPQFPLLIWGPRPPDPPLSSTPNMSPLGHDTCSVIMVHVSSFNKSTRLEVFAFVTSFVFNAWLTLVLGEQERGMPGVSFPLDSVLPSIAKWYDEGGQFCSKVEPINTLIRVFKNASDKFVVQSYTCHTTRSSSNLCPLHRIVFLHSSTCSRPSVRPSDRPSDRPSVRPPARPSVRQDIVKTIVFDNVSRKINETRV